MIQPATCMEVGWVVQGKLWVEKTTGWSKTCVFNLSILLHDDEKAERLSGEFVIMSLIKLPIPEIVNVI